MRNMLRLIKRNEYILISHLVIYLLTIVSMHGCFMVASEPTNPKLNNLKKD